MVALPITRTIVIIISWINIKEVHAKGPQLNTLYVEIGQLYPCADFAGVLIDLNVDKAIAKGKSALNLTDCFLQYNKARQIIGKYTGANRNIHFLSLKRHQVQHNLNILTTDLYQITEQYRIPGSRHPHSPSRHPKHPRDPLIRSKSRWTKWSFVPPDWSQSSPTSPLIMMKSFTRWRLTFLKMWMKFTW